MSSGVSLSDAIELVDTSKFLEGVQDEDSCGKVASSLRQFGAVLIRDPRVDAEDSARFLDMMERYFSLPRGEKLKDARPELFYQVGVTPDGIERPRDNSRIAENLLSSEKPISDPGARLKDPKWRFFWRCGKRPVSTDFPELNAPQVIPTAFEDEWADTMNAWGEKLMSTVMIVSEMLARGLGLAQNAFRELLELGYHYDLNILTIHGRARYPGLYVWTRTGKRIPVVVPDGCLLVQSGIQLEHLTAGEIQKGMHEVVVSPETSEAAKRVKGTGGSMWRVSSTLFAHVRSDAILAPLGHFASSPDAGRYPPQKAGDQVAQELKALELAT